MDYQTENRDQTYMREDCPKPGFLNSTLALMSLTGLFVQESRAMFSKPVQHIPGLADLIWVPKHDDPDGVDVEHTTIHIDSADRAMKRLAGFKPGIIVKRKGRKLLDEKALQDSSYTGLTFDGGKNHIRWWQGQYEICATTDGRGTAEVLGEYIAEYYLQFGPAIKKDFQFFRLEVVEVSEAFVLEEEKSMWCVVTTLDYIYKVEWELAQMRPRFSGLALDIE